MYHGTIYSYQQGCRCDDCKDAGRVYRKELKARNLKRLMADPEFRYWQEQEVERLLEMYRMDPARALMDKKFIKACREGLVKLETVK